MMTSPSRGQRNALASNNNFLVNGAQTLSQKPLLRLEEHVSRNLTDALWLSIDAYYNLGGETSIDGIDQDNMANTLRIGAGMGLRLWRGADLGLNYASSPNLRVSALLAKRAVHLETTLVEHSASAHAKAGRSA